MQWRASDPDCYGRNKLIIIQEQGDNTPTVFTFTNDDETPVNLTGMSFEGTIDFPTSVSLALGSGLETTDAANGELTMQLLSSQTQTITPGQYDFDIWQVGTEATPVVTDPIRGVWIINEALTVIS